MKNYKYILLITVLIAAKVNCQSNIERNKFSKTIDNIGSGFMQAAEWYDIPIGIAYFSSKYINEYKFGNTFSIPPSGIDEEFNEMLSVPGSNSLGSIDKDYFPNAIFLGRFLFASSVSLFTNSNNVNAKTFRDIFLFKKALVYTYTLTEYSKTFVKRERPDGTDTRSFFSGHTSTTFATSTFLYLELRRFFDNWEATRSNPTLKQVMRISSFSLLYGWAGYVGYSRIRDNKHYLTDVLLGAAIGTVTSLFVFNLYNNEEDSIVKKLSLHPGANSSLNLSFNMNF